MICLHMLSKHFLAISPYELSKVDSRDHTDLGRKAKLGQPQPKLKPETKIVFSSRGKVGGEAEVVLVVGEACKSFCSG